MIDELKIIDPVTPELERKFPKGLELKTNSSINLVIGPNFSGKTAFQRMLATSIEFNNYFQEKNKSYFFEYSQERNNFQEVIESLKEAKLNEMAFGLIPPEWSSIINLCTRRGILNEENCKRGSSGTDLKTGAEIIEITHLNKKGIEDILNFTNRLSEPTDENIYGFIKIVSKEPGKIYSQTFDIPVDWKNTHLIGNGVRKYLYFCPENRFRGFDSSPGKTSNEELVEEIYKKVSDFFEKQKGRKLKEQKKGLSELEARITGNMDKIWYEAEKVQKNAQICILMDEPTIFLDPRNNLKFQENIKQLTKKYNPRLQFFISTNDYGLMQNLEGDCNYINLYDNIAQSIQELEI